ncbi:receptor-like protein kinase ANXUR2, partial [Trifolium pratense]
MVEVRQGEGGLESMFRDRWGMDQTLFSGLTPGWMVLRCGSGGEAWEWRRQLRAWEEEMLGECQAFLLTISLQDHVSDRWQWRADLDDGYTVRGAYQLLT